MPVSEQRRSTAGTKSANRPPARPHSRSSSNGSAHRVHTLGGLTALHTISGKEKEVKNGMSNLRRKSNGSSKATSPDPPESRSPPRGVQSQTAHIIEGVAQSSKPSRRTKEVPPPMAEDDEDEWVSSESGAVTPNAVGDQDPMRNNHGIQLRMQPSMSPSRTPPATRQPLPPLTEPFIQRTPSPAEPATLGLPERPPHHRSHSAQLASEVTLAARSKDQQPHHHHHHPPPNPLLRPSLMIRAASTTTPPLASPSYLTVQPLQAALSESPPQHGSPPLYHSHRKGSVSSSRSAATLPVTPNFAYSPTDNHPRMRTMSTMSSTSSAAISSLAAIPAHHTYQSNHGSSSGSSMPPLPVTSRFPLHDTLLDAHPLIDYPFAVEHAAIIRIYDPLGESFNRVAKAKVASKKIAKRV
ncbi:hypothetical protein FRB96_002761 [Tulasnella sp. 330]|nr:hypothetical protein FRB96_002761 [Tulasnella sp. 330]KAG8875917.1 hypothetical protein FRB97_004623 [Tulasnella sp. 331]